MRLTRKIKDVNTYIKEVYVDQNFNAENIIVEHRSNNPKRDFLFVNRAQCKHIPASPLDMKKMCKTLADKVNESLHWRYENVLVVGFAETATAIGTNVARELRMNCYNTHTTREEVEGAVQLITFEEEHSHATTQRLLTYGDNPVDLSQFDYVLFVEDEISTGKTILNFIDAFEKVHSGLKYGVASICNWQNLSDRAKFTDRDIDTFSLISGSLKDANIKMESVELSTNTYENVKESDGVKIITLDLHKDKSRFELNRLGEHVNNSGLPTLCKTVLDELVKCGDIKSVRIIGTEEFMDMPIELGYLLELDNKLDVICHATTRSKIDVMNDYGTGCNNGIKVRYEIPSAYEDGRKTYIYNTDEKTDVTIIISDSLDAEQFKKCVRALGTVVEDRCNKILAIRVC